MTVIVFQLSFFNFLAGCTFPVKGNTYLFNVYGDIKLYQSKLTEMSILHLCYQSNTCDRGTIV